MQCGTTTILEVVPKGATIVCCKPNDAETSSVLVVKETGLPPNYDLDDSWFDWINVPHAGYTCYFYGDTFASDFIGKFLENVGNATLKETAHLTADTETGEHDYHFVWISLDKTAKFKTEIAENTFEWKIMPNDFDQQFKHFVAIMTQ